MKFTLLLSLAVSLTSFNGVLSSPAPQDLMAISSMSEAMSELAQAKYNFRESERKNGVFDKGRYKSNGKFPCVNGKSAGEYSCANIDMRAFLSHEDMGSVTREGNDVWGWTSADGREFGAVGQTDGTAFVEVMRDGSLKYVARLPTQTVSSIWRDIKVIGDHAYIGSEAKGHGLQIFDMRKLTTVKPGTSFDIAKDLTAHFAGFGNSHNIVANPETNFIYAVGTSFCGKGGLFFVDVSDPSNPRDAGCASEDGYVHDAQCVIYRGPDAAYRGKEICFGYNEDTLTIYDVTDKSKPIIISRTPYQGAAYTHQGWLANPEMTHLLLDDELDEMKNTAQGGNNKTTTYLWDIRKLTAPVNTGYYKSQAKAIDHNQYVIDGISYQSNYGSGLRIVDVSSIVKSPDGHEMYEMGHFDVHPEDDADEQNQFYGSWSVYPYFRSGNILLNSIERGLYSLKYTGPKAKYAGRH